MIIRAEPLTRESFQAFGDVLETAGIDPQLINFGNTQKFGKLAEIVGQYLKKGSKIYVEGKLQTRKWQGQDGQDKYTTEVVVDIGGTMQMLDSRGEGAGSAPAQSAPSQRSTQPAPAMVDDGFDDDIPF